jgi:hypothetical protein
MTTFPAMRQELYPSVCSPAVAHVRHGGLMLAVARLVGDGELAGAEHQLGGGRERDRRRQQCGEEEA